MKRIFQYFGMAAGAFVIGAGLQMSAAAKDWEPTMPRPATSGGEVTLDRGKKVYVENCVKCHDLNGKGFGTKRHVWPDDQFMPNLSDGEYMNDRGEEIYDSVRGGRRNFDPPYVVMPAFRYILSEEDIQSVIAYVKTMPKMSGMTKK